MKGGDQSVGRIRAQKKVQLHLRDQEAFSEEMLHEPKFKILVGILSNIDEHKYV
jgi:hypothetical protein